MERRRVRGPFARWPVGADVVLAVAVFALNAFTDDAPGDEFLLRGLGDVPMLGLVMIALGSAALVWRRRHPLVVMGIVVAASALAIPVDEGPVAALPFAVYTAGRYGEESRENTAGVVAALGVLVVGGIREQWLLGETLFGLVFVVLAWYVGRRLRLRGQLEQEDRRRREAEAAQALADERTRIARELHDVVAHRVSLMTVQAGAAKTVVADDPEAAYRSMEAVEQAGRQALGELRHLLGVLRPEGDGTRAPQPGLADLPHLAAQFDEAGLDVRLEVADGAIDLPARVELAAYRIVQESLTNALKHAGPGAHAEVVVRVTDTEVALEVVNDGRPGVSPPTTGHGIPGMRERAQLLGGRLHAGPRPEGGFRVAAHLPIDPEPA